MDGAVVALVSIAIVAAAAGAGYRRLRAKSLPTISDEEFVRAYCTRYAANVASELILTERNRIAKVLGLAPEKLAPEQDVEMLSARLSYLADFSVAWNDLADEAAEARDASGLPPRRRPPLTIGEIIEDRLRVRPLG